MKPADRIRPAVESDTPVILELIKALAEFEKLSHDVVATEAKLRTTLFGARPAAEVIIAEIETSSGWQNAGFALYFSSYSTFLALPGMYLEDLFVRPEFRSHGLGEKMLSRLAQIAVERGYGRLEWSVLDWNTRAWDFYRRLGAKPMSEWTVHRVTGQELKELAERMHKESM